MGGGGGGVLCPQLITFADGDDDIHLKKTNLMGMDNDHVSGMILIICPSHACFRVRPI